jgi:3D (Asp-Asp-Asp) domain-containing protein
VTLLAIGIVFSPKNQLAAQVVRPNETQTNINGQENTKILDKLLAASQLSKLQLVFYDLQKHEPEETLEEIERNSKLAHFKDKLAAANFPKGKFPINASAYTAAADECGKSDGITASGLKVKENRTLACPPSFPFGSKLKIEGMGTYVCEDRGGAIKGNHFDIYMQTKKQAFSFGRRILLAEVVK